MRIRIAEGKDSADIAAIYAPIVERTHISFELAPPSPAEMARRMSAALENHAFLVADAGGHVDGYAYASRYREKPAYAWSAETTIYVRDAARGTGIGRSLYRALLQILAAQNYRRAFAGIALPNPASVALHEAVGFRHVGINPEAGFKFDRWHDLGWWSLQLNDLAGPPAAIVPLSKLVDPGKLLT